MKDFAEELEVRKQVMNLLTELKRGDEGGSMGHPPAAKPEQVEQLLEETKELVEQLKAERGKETPR